MPVSSIATPSNKIVKSIVPQKNVIARTKFTQLPDVIETQNIPRGKHYSNEPNFMKEMKQQLYEFFCDKSLSFNIQQPYIDRAVRGVRPLMVHGIPIKTYTSPVAQEQSPYYIDRAVELRDMPTYVHDNLANTLAININPFPPSVYQNKTIMYPIASMEAPIFQYRGRSLFDWQPHRNRDLKFETPFYPTPKSFAGTYRDSIIGIKRSAPHEWLNR